jgi:23S rRNA G2069 N7-methylase RlmK/C1962 C5-methylase RlmI
MPESSTPHFVGDAVAARRPFIDAAHGGAFRLFNGHLEGDPRFVVDVYARTLVVFVHAARTVELEVELEA